MSCLPIATQAEAEAGTVNDKPMTPLRVKQAIDALGVSEEVLASPAGGAMVGNQLPAGSNLQIQDYSTFVADGILMPSQFAGTPQQQLVNAITEAATPRDNALGQTVEIPRGEIPVSTSFNLDNRATVRGVNKRGSRIVAQASHAGPSMVTVINGATSTFDNRLQDLTLDCNDVASLTGVISSAWQEGGGLRDVLIQKFRGCGVDIVDTIGGASLLNVSDSELMGSAQGAVAGIRIDDPSLVSSFILNMERVSIVGGAPVANPGNPTQQAAARASMPACIDVLNGSTTSTGVHCEVAERGFRLDGNGRHIIIGAKGSSPNGTSNAGVETLVEIAATFTGTVIMIGCSCNGAINFVKDLRPGGFGTITYDLPYFRIGPDQPLEYGANVAGGNFDGALSTPNIDHSFGVSGITRNSAGNYTIALSRTASSASNYAVFASSNYPGGTVTCVLSGVGFVDIVSRNASGDPADANEMKFLVVRVP